MKVEGKCHCGQITYAAEVDPARASACHCTDCQMISGASYRVSVPVPRESFELKSGQLKIYIKTAESGNRRVHAFCPDCGTPVYASAVDDPPTYSLRIGCLDKRAELPPQRQIWCRSALGWSMNLEGVERVERQ
ncbi:MAG: GFA family protein [Betaproteobacteria bacterium]